VREVGSSNPELAKFFAKGLPWSSKFYTSVCVAREGLRTNGVLDLKDFCKNKF